MENKIINDQEKIYFIPGNVVTLKHDIPNKPIMLVTEVVTSKIMSNPNYWGGQQETRQYFKGIRCVWFTTNLEMQESIFSTKDLVKV